MITENELTECVEDLVKVFLEGRNYDPMNPYIRPEVKKALKLLGKIQGKNWLDVKV